MKETRMIDLLLNLKPDVLSTTQFFMLIGLSGLTSMLNIIIGVGGGATLIAAMITIMPATAVIPVHAIVQLGSNAGRAVLMREHIQKQFLPWFFVGCVAGAIVGGNIALNLPAKYLELILALFILISAWVPIKLSLQGKSGLIGIGAFTSFLTMFVGATGPFLISTMKGILPERRELSATMSCFMSIQHVIKAIIFGVLGFAYQQWLGMIGLMILSGFVGTFLGKKVLDRVSNQHFHIVLKLTLTLISLHLIWEFFNTP